MQFFREREERADAFSREVFPFFLSPGETLLAVLSPLLNKSSQFHCRSINNAQAAVRIKAR